MLTICAGLDFVRDDTVITPIIHCGGVLIEVQTGAHLGEDDIVRYEDISARRQGARG